MSHILSHHFPTTMGRMEIQADTIGIVRLYFCSSDDGKNNSYSESTLAHNFSDVIAGIQNYLQGEPQALDSLNWNIGSVGTVFQRKVWEVMRSIPSGKSLTYGEIAKKIGQPGSARAIGGACHANPILLLNPCHRVLSKSGLGGFALGTSFKMQLLALEADSLVVA